MAIQLQTYVSVHVLCTISKKNEHIILPDIYTYRFLLPKQLVPLYIHIHNLCRDSHLAFHHP